jgi:hypothetical protein
MTDCECLLPQEAFAKSFSNNIRLGFASLQTTEVFLYVFDAALIFLVTFILAVCHPSEMITDEYGTIVHPDGSQELGSLVSLGPCTPQEVEGHPDHKIGRGRRLGQ